MGKAAPARAIVPRIEIAVIFLFTLSVLSLLALLGIAGRAGVWISAVLGVILGETKIVAPFALAGWAAFLLKQKIVRISFVHTVGALFLIFSVTAFFHLRFSPADAFGEAIAGHGGGLAGFFLADSLQLSVGFWGAIMVLIAIFSSAFLIVFNTSLRAAYGVIGSWFGSIAASVTSIFSGIGLVFMRRGSSQSVLDEEAESAAGEEDEDEPDFSKKNLSPSEAPAAAALMQKREEMEVLEPKKKSKHIHLSLSLLNSNKYQPTSGDIKTNLVVIQKTLENFGISVEMGEVNVGPTVTQYTLKPADGVKLASITALQNDLALSLAAHPIRIEAPIPGRALVGIEVPNQKAALVPLRDILDSEEFKKRKNTMQIALGKDVAGRARLASLIAMPHMLIAGSTGSGKTVCLNSLIVSLLFQNSPNELRFIMVDPKRVELHSYNEIPHLLTPVVTDVKKAMNALRWAINEMERRFGLLAKATKRDIASYNKSNPAEILPYIVVIIDELAEIMQTVGQEAEPLIIRLAQMARAVGIHLVLATQRPSVDVITGLIKANITSRIAFAVASSMDSRTILDTPGAEKLIGRGDMLYISAELSKPVRIQGAYLSDEEIERVTKHLKESGEPSYESAVVEKPVGMNGPQSGGFDDDGDDELLPDAREAITIAGKASASLLQRRLRVGYARAARLLDLLEAQGFIGPADGARPREILLKRTDEFGPSVSYEEDIAEEEKV